MFPYTVRILSSWATITAFPNVEGKKSESSLYSSIIAVITPVSEAFIFDGSANINEELIVFPLNCPKYE